eukprot:scaffold8126_cov170-Amphora_coffeaeformis.AAC.17
MDPSFAKFVQAWFPAVVNDDDDDDDDDNASSCWIKASLYVLQYDCNMQQAVNAHSFNERTPSNGQLRVR